MVKLVTRFITDILLNISYVDFYPNKLILLKDKIDQLRSKITKFDSALKAAEDIKAKVWEIDHMEKYLNINHDIPHNSILKIDWKWIKSIV